MEKRIGLLCVFIFAWAIAYSARLHILVTDTDGESLAACSIALSPGNKAVLTDIDGACDINVEPGEYLVKAAYVGFEDFSQHYTISSDTTLTIKLHPASRMLGELTVTARESHGAVSTTRIGSDAMSHLQPSSFADLLELLPGNISQDPSMGQAQTITLRETGTIGALGQRVDAGDYATSALGTQFRIDGAPIGSDASMQSVGTSGAERTALNRGTDMRTIATDNIESVEVVRGIPSAEYGNLSSGMVTIHRKHGATPWTARFKADGFSKLFYGAKGFGLGTGTINLDLGWLDSKTDPRDNLENFSRITASARYALQSGAMRLNISGDYTGTIDKTKTDPDLSLRKINEYHSSRDEFALNASLTYSLDRLSWLDRIMVQTSARYSHETLTRRLQVAPTRATITPTNMQEGDFDAAFILKEYIADYLCDGKPLDLYAKVRLEGNSWNLGRYKLGAEWTMSKNYGLGQVYDPTRPVSAGWAARPRAFNDIPALNTTSAFLEDIYTAAIGNNSLEIHAGIHLTALVGLDKKYYISGRPYLDPRANALWRFPKIGNVTFTLAGGYGLNTRMPTIDYLFPQVAYLDMVQLNYYDTVDPAGASRANVRTYIRDAANYDLRPARNSKWEIRLGLDFGANTMQLTYLRENMSSGFRYATQYEPFSYRRYDASGHTPGTKPDLSTLPYTDETVLRGFRRVENGSTIDKTGVELTFTTARWKAIATAMSVTGAWFRSKYNNSLLLFDPVNDVVGNTAVSDKYIGLYNSNDGRINEQLATNITFDTQIPRYGLIFTASFQCMWYVKTRRLEENGTPDKYLSAADGLLHDYDEAAANDPMLRYLIQHYNPDLFNTYTVPPALYLNLKATKQIGRWLKVAVFVNRLLDYLPDYKSNGLTIRRTSNPYFGMELNFTI